MKKIIAFDLDGTLTESKQAITLEMAHLIYALSLKTKVVVISGGSYHQFKEQFIPGILEAAKSENMNGLQNIILLPTSGSKRYEYDAQLRDWKEVYAYPFPEDIKKRALAALHNIVDERKAEFDIPEEHFGEYIEDRGTQITLSALGQEAPLEKKQAWDPTGEKRKKIRDALAIAVPDADSVVGGMTSVDILAKGEDKAMGLKVLLQDRGLTLEDMLFIGDAVFEGGNDYSPLKAGIETKAEKGPKETAELIQSLLRA